MKKTLDDLCSMEGLNAAFVCTNEGELVEFIAPRVYDAETLCVAASFAARAIESISVQHSEWDSIVASFKDGKLLFIGLDNYLLCVVSELSAATPFLNVAIKVAKNKLKSRLNGSSIGMTSTGAYSSQFVPEPSTDRNHLTSSQSGFSREMISSTIQQAYVNTAKAPSASSFGGGSSELLWSGMGASGMQSSTVSVADATSSQTLTKISEALAEIVGPMAKVFVKEAVQKICPTEPFSMNHLPTLLNELEKEHITEKQEIKQFRDSINR